MADKRLLVVDDEPDFGDFVRQVAEGSGYEVTVTTGGKEFMEVYDDVDPTVVVLDMVMPEIEGTELVQWLAARRCDAKVIIITGFHPDYAAVAGKLGKIRGLKSVTTLVKPVGAAQIAHRPGVTTRRGPVPRAGAEFTYFGEFANRRRTGCPTRPPRLLLRVNCRRR